MAQALATLNPVYLGPWLEALRPARAKLNSRLAAIFRDKTRPESERAMVTSILVDYAADAPDLVADLLLEADPEAYAVVFPLVERHGPTILPSLRAEIAREATVTDGDNDPESAKDRLAGRQARAAVALLRLGAPDEVLPLLRHSADPRLRSFVINSLNPLGADPRALAAALERMDPGGNPTGLRPPGTMDAVLFHPETSERRALILALGTYGVDGLPGGDREPLAGKLLDLYRNDPDAGVHGAAEWALRRWDRGGKLEAVDAELVALKEWGDRRWFVNGQGQTFSVIEGPVEFQKGSPQTERARKVDETSARRIISRRFAVASKEVTVGQFLRFGKAYPQYLMDGGDLAHYSPESTGPMVGVP
jgi:hypothetical protein